MCKAHYKSGRVKSQREDEGHIQHLDKAGRCGPGRAGQGVLHRRQAIHHIDRNFTVVFIGGDVRQVLELHRRVQRNAVLHVAEETEGITHQDDDVLGRHVDIGVVEIGRIGPVDGQGAGGGV